ncbi:MAG: DUF1292 domain-containing protein [Oscillospiraceae bacterium]|nr:DUF1292 domain-containing protein [Oscillospiraceae bacterium]
MADDFENELVTVLDEDGNEHQFELLDAIETENGRFVALLPVYDEASDYDDIDDDGELIILSVENEDGEDTLIAIEDQALFDEIADIFEERLSELYEIDALQ